ncbi:MAG: GIY-YIG nuclease family protein [Rhodospirillales bacterium]|nr:GIY-YIG nuclease family protein [Rhodospirillales bacterium]
MLQPIYRSDMKTKTWYGFTVNSENIPQQRPGVYLIQHIESGRPYVGISYNIAQRIRQHAGKSQRASRIGEAIASEGRSCFLVVPLYYALGATSEGLEVIEAEFIAQLDSVERGYNVLQSSRGAGPYGKTFSTLVRESLASDEAKRKRAERLADPEVRKRQGRLIRAGQWTPEGRANMLARKPRKISDEERERASARMRLRFGSEAQRAAIGKIMRERWADPVLRLRHLEICRAANQNPDRNAKIAASRSGKHWITNGASERFVPIGDTLPTGWIKGRK